MKKKYLFVKGACQWNKLVHKFLNLRKRVAGQMKNGQFQLLSCDEQNRLYEKLRELTQRLERMQHKVGVKLASGILLFTLSTGTAAAQTFAPASDLQTTGISQKLSGQTFVDIDNDSDLDLFVGIESGYVKYYQNNGTSSVPDFALQGNLQDSAAVDIKVNNNATTTFADIDNDGDLDLLVGQQVSWYSNIKYYKNNGTASVPEFVDQGVLQDSSVSVIEIWGYEGIHPVLADLDQDGDFDLFIGDSYGYITYYENTGDTSSYIFSARGNLQDSTNTNIWAHSEAVLFFVDIDNDGDLDLMVRESSSGNIKYYENKPGVNPFDLVFAGNLQYDNGGSPEDIIEFVYSVPTFADIDNDGDFDLFIKPGELSHIRYYENTGTPSAHNFIRGPFLEGGLHTIDLDKPTPPSMFDIDSDGDLDLFYSTYGNIFYYKNTGTELSAVFTPQDLLRDTSTQAISVSLPNATFADIDNDNDLDLFIGSNPGSIAYYENTGDSSAYEFTPLGNLKDFMGADITTGTTFYNVPAFEDIDNDGDLDLFYGGNTGLVKYSENMGNANSHSFGTPTSLQDNTYTDIDAGNSAAPAFADADHDGDPDLFLGNTTGTVSYYKNTGNASAFSFTSQGSLKDSTGTPINAVNYSKPGFADLDHDGDPDLLVGGYNGTIMHYTNETPGVWKGATDTYWSNAVNWQDNILPNSTMIVLIPDEAVNIADIGSDTAFAQNIIIESGAELAFGNGSLNIDNNLTNYGTFSAGTGTTIFNMSATVKGTVKFNNVTIWDMIDFGPSSTINGILDITQLGYIDFNPPLVIAKTDQAIYCSNGAAVVSSQVIGLGVSSYQWRESNDGGVTWYNLSNGGIYSNVTATSLNISDVAGLNAYQYKCTVTNMIPFDTYPAIIYTVDSIPPVAIAKNISVALDSTGNANIIAADVDSLSTDNCGIASLTVAPDTFTCSDIGSNIVTLIVTDNTSNADTVTATVTIQDTIAPVITNPADIIVCENLSIVNYSNPTATDICGIDTITQINGLVSGSVFPVGITTNIFVAEDISGNTDTCNFTVTVNPVYSIGDAPFSICDGDSSLIYGSYYNVPGTYYDSLTSVYGCDSLRSTVLTVNPLPAVDLGADTTICNGCSIPLDAGSGFTSYLWSTGDTIQTITVIITDVYSVTVIDSNGCSASDTVIVTVFSAGPLAGVSGVDVSCNPPAGGCDGEAVVTVAGGTMPYTYLWDDPASQITATAVNLCAGNYSVIVTDSASLADTAYITINEPVVLTTVITGTDVSTCGAGDGSASVTTSGGTLPYTYNWSNGDTTQNPLGLSGGTYSVTVTDANGCNAYDNVYIIETSTFTTGITGIDVSGCGAADGAIDLAVAGGVAPFTYIWSNSDSTQDLSGLSAGIYSVTIIDSTSCLTNDLIMINEPPVFTTSIAATDVSCSGGNNAAADLTISGGVAPFTFSWSNGAATEDVSSLSAGTYTVTVTDTNGCFTDNTITINELPPLTVTTLVQGTSSCGASDAIAMVSVSGGAAPFKYVWSNGDTLANASALSSGIHYVTVTDANGCIAYGTVTVNESGGTVITVNSIVDVTCNGYANGSIDIGVSGGTLPYSYLWSNGSATEDISNLTGGTYEVVITDFSGCIASASFTVTKPDPLSASLSIVDASCNGADGSAVINVNGGTIPYTYMWSTFGTGSSQMGLSAGVYSVTVIDANACVYVTPVVINSLGGPSITVNSITNVNCDYPDDGSIDISVTGGSQPYIYQWSNSDTTEDLIDLTDATYNVTVTDAKGCVAAASIDILYMPPLDVKICIITVDSATGKNLIVWEKEPGLSIDSYNIYKEGTQANVYFRIGTVPYDSLSIFVDLQANPAQRSWRYKLTAGDTCISESESEMSPLHKSIHLTVNLGLNGEVNLIWDHYEGFAFGTYYIYRGSSPNDMDSLDALPSNLNSYTDFSPPSGQLFYQVAAILPTGCTATLKTKDYNSSKSNTTAIASAGTLSATATATDATFGNCDGSATVTAKGGTPPYTYQWNDSLNQVTATATGLCGDTTYTVLVTDAYGDTVSTNVFVDEVSGINQQSAILNPQLKVYPNPNRGIFNLNIYLGKKEDLNIKIFDIQGQKIYSDQTVKYSGSFEKQIDLSEYNGGIYHLQVITKENVINRKIVIE
ncbi:MAG: FG-GAP-like repeat-containing protein [Bacteroidota bacterium]